MRPQPIAEAARAALLAAICSCLVVPKLLLIHYAAGHLSLGHSTGDLPFLLAQDVLTASVAFLALSALLRSASPVRLGVAATATGLLLLLLMLDCRTRELWLKPVTLQLVQYTIAEMGDLRASGDLFFGRSVGWNMSLRRALFNFALIQAALWTLLAGVLWLRSRSGAARGAFPGRWETLTAGAVAIGAMAVSVSAPSYRYDLEENVVARLVVNAVRTEPASAQPQAAIAGAFDQPARPLNEVLASAERRIAADVEPFRNLVIFLFESLRWNGMDFAGTGPTPAPHLRALGREGLLVRTYASLPHSTKAYFTILTGRYPFPGMEMREMMAERHESFLWALREQRGAQLMAFGSMFFDFENADMMLRAVGIDFQRDANELVPRDQHVSAWGARDDVLGRVTPEIVAQVDGPFAAIYVPLAAHHPYEYPGKTDPSDDSLDAYLKSVADADRDLQGLLDSLRERQLLRDTLVVVIGDHGQSFGEHGTFVHGNSMYEEELTVPAVFWSEDGRLRHAGVLEGRQIDVAPTIADLLGLRDGDWNVQGESLLRARERGPVYATSFFDGVAQALIVGDTKYIHSPSSGELHRFDLDADPEERRPELVLDTSLRSEVIHRLAAFDAYQRGAHRH